MFSTVVTRKRVVSSGFLDSRQIIPILNPVSEAQRVRFMENHTKNYARPTGSAFPTLGLIRRQYWPIFYANE
jgi:hypothetical protein